MVMNQTKVEKDVHGQILYQGRWVDKKHFRAFLYNETEQRLANSYNEYEQMIASGLWFDNQELAIKAKVKPVVEKKVKKAKVEADVAEVNESSID